MWTRFLMIHETNSIKPAVPATMAAARKALSRCADLNADQWTEATSAAGTKNVKSRRNQYATSLKMMIGFR